MYRKSTVLLLLGILLATCAIRLYFASRCTAVPDYSDMALYNAAAMKHGFPTSLPPGYPLFLKVIYGLFGALNYTAVFVVQGLISTVTVLLMYRVASAVGGRGAGLLAAGIASVYPNFIVYNLTALTETIGVLFVMLLLAVLVAAMSEKKRSILAAFALFLGFTFRPVIILFAPGVFLSLRRRWTFAIAAVALLGPLIVFEMTAGESFQRSAVAVYETYHPSLDGSQFINPDSMELGSDTLSSTLYLKTALTNIAHNRWKATDNIYNKAAVLFSRGWDRFVLQPIVGTGAYANYIMVYAYIPVLLFGFIGMARLYGGSNRMLALPALSYLVFVILFFLFKFRYRLLIEPVLIIYASMLLAGTRIPARKVDESVRSSGMSSPARAGRNGDILAVILLLALALRIYFAFAYRTPSDTATMAEYNRLALQGGLGSSAAPLYPLFLRAVYFVFGAGDYTALFLAQGIMSALVVAMMYIAVARLCNRTAGIIAAAICAIFPDFLIYNLTVSVESMSIFLVVVLMAVSAVRFGAGYGTALSAVLVGLGMLAEPRLLCLAPGAFLTARRKKLFIIALFLTLAPFVALNSIRSGRIVLVYETHVFGLGLENYSDSRGWRQTGDNIYYNAAAIMMKGWLLTGAAAGDGVEQASTSAAICSYAVVMLMGFIGLARYYRKEHAAAVLPVLLYAVILVLFSRFEVMHRAPFEPILIAYAAVLLSGGCPAPVVRQGEP